jgi:hypothetical protein
MFIAGAGAAFTRSLERLCVPVKRRWHRRPSSEPAPLVARSRTVVHNDGTLAGRADPRGARGIADLTIADC